MSGFGYGNNSLYGGPTQPIGRYPHGQALDAQITCHLPLKIRPANVLRERYAAYAGPKIGTFEGPAQLDIVAKAPVFRPRRRYMTPEDIAIDESAFATFDGLPKWFINNDKQQGIDVYKYHQNFMWSGFALDPYKFPAASAGQDLIDVQVKGIANYVNGSGRVVQPGEPMSWIPDLPELDNVVAENPHKRQRTNRGSIVGARIVPLADVVAAIAKSKYATFDNDAADKLRAALKKTRDAFEHDTAKFAQPPAERQDAIDELLQLLQPMALKDEDLIVGMNCTALPPDTEGPIALY
jgi:hypothetical protein